VVLLVVVVWGICGVCCCPVVMSGLACKVDRVGGKHAVGCKHTAALLHAVCAQPYCCNSAPVWGASILLQCCSSVQAHP
jgi:hypothetical protein